MEEGGDHRKRSGEALRDAADNILRESKGDCGGLTQIGVSEDAPVQTDKKCVTKFVKRY